VKIPLKLALSRAMMKLFVQLVNLVNGRVDGTLEGKKMAQAKGGLFRDDAPDSCPNQTPRSQKQRRSCWSEYRARDGVSERVKNRAQHVWVLNRYSVQDCEPVTSEYPIHALAPAPLALVAGPYCGH